MDARTFNRTLQIETKRLEKGGSPNADLLIKIVRTLTEIEIEPGGPYAFGNKPDLTTNIRIARFLSLYGVHVSKLDDFIAKTRKKNTKPVPTSKTSTKPQVSNRISAEEIHILQMTQEVIRKRLRGVSSDLQQQVLRVIDRVMHGEEGRQIPLMPQYMRSALGKNGKRFDDAYIAQAGLASISFWMATIVYDDFWDEDESARPEMLPAANFLQRNCIRHFTSLLPKVSGFESFVHEYLDRTDAANTWEVTQCRVQILDHVLHIPKRLPEYGDFSIKFYPAAGHIFAPVAMLVALGHSVTSSEVRNLISYFQHYLVAMQLNDDAHDWKEDMGQGHISTIVWMLLHEWRSKFPRKYEIHLIDDMGELERLFWFKVLPAYSNAVRMHTNQARKALFSVKSIENPAPLERFISRNEVVAQKASEEFQSSQLLIQAFAH